MRAVWMVTTIAWATLAGAGLALAESRVTAVSAPIASLSSTSRLAVAVNVPKILYLRVGNAGATINTVTMTVGVAAASGLNPLPRTDVSFAGTVPIGMGTVTRTDNDGAPNGIVAAQLWTNNGTATLTCTGAPLTDGSRTIPLTQVLVTSLGGGTLGHPGANLGCSTVSRGTSGTNNLTSNWSYNFSAAGGLPTAGSYTTQITYVASQP